MKDGGAGGAVGGASSSKKGQPRAPTVAGLKRPSLAQRLTKKAEDENRDTTFYKDRVANEVQKAKQRHIARMEADFLSISSAKAAGDRVRSIQRRGRAVHVWTVNDVSNALSMIEMGVDNIITDDPGLIRALLDEWNELSPPEKVTLMLRDLIVGLDPPPPAEL